MSTAKKRTRMRSKACGMLSTMKVMSSLASLDPTAMVAAAGDYQKKCLIPKNCLQCGSS